MKKLVVCSLLVVLTSTLTAQIWRDPFNYSPGTVVGNWAEYLKDWKATGTTAVAEDIRNYQYMTQPNRTLRDCCVECKVIYNTAATSTLQLAGVTIRTNDPGGSTLGRDLIHFKYQGSNGFSIIYLYENSVGGTLNAVSTSTSQSNTGTVRLLAIDSRVIAQLDNDGDGLWDYTLTKTVTLPVKAGPIGICGYGGSIIDDYEVFNAVLASAVNSPAPKPGNTIALAMRGRQNAPYLAALSLGSTGIPLPSNITIPLVLDGLFRASIAGAVPGLGGVLDNNGDGTLNIRIPNFPVLVGTTFFTAYVNYSTAITEISNDHQVTIS